MAELWWEPREIIFNKEQVLWLLAWLLSIREGNWPPDHRYTGYTDALGVTKTRSHRAPFEASCQVAAELDVRIRACGQDGEMLNAYYCHGLEVSRIARLVKMDEGQVSRRIGRALRYIASGPDRRWHDTPKRKAQTYQEFISHRGPASREGWGVIQSAFSEDRADTTLEMHSGRLL